MMSGAAIGSPLLGGFSRPGHGTPWKWTGRREGGRLACVAPGPRTRPRREAAFQGPVGWRAADAAPEEEEEAVRSVLDRGRHRGRHGETMAPQNLGTFCLLLLYLIGTVIAG